MERDQVIAYIRRQQTHHRRITFQSEFRKFLTSYEVEFDERYVWDELHPTLPHAFSVHES